MALAQGFQMGGHVFRAGIFAYAHGGRVLKHQQDVVPARLYPCQYTLLQGECVKIADAVKVKCQHVHAVGLWV